MALNNIDSLEFDSTNLSYKPDIIHVSGNVYAIVYSGTDGDGFLVTVDIDTAGGIGAVVIASLEFDAVSARYPKILHVSGNIYAIAYGMYPDVPGYLEKLVTVSISTDGLTLAVVDSVTVESFISLRCETDFIHVSGTVYAIVFTGSGGDGWIYTISIANDGTIGAVISTYEYDTVIGATPRILHIAGTTYAIAYRGVSGDDPAVVVKTLTMADDGNITAAVIDSLIVGLSQVGAGSSLDIVLIIGDIYAIVYTDNSNKGAIATITIDSAGNISDNVVDSAFYDTYFGYFPRIVLVSAGKVGIVYYGIGTGYRQAYVGLSVAADGTITGNPNTFAGISADGLAIDAVAGGWCGLVSIGNLIYAVPYQGVDTDGFVATFGLGEAVPSDPVARVSSIRHIYRPGSLRMLVAVDDIGFDVDIAEVSVRRL